DQPDRGPAHPWRFLRPRPRPAPLNIGIVASYSGCQRGLEVGVLSDRPTNALAATTTFVLLTATASAPGGQPPTSKWCSVTAARKPRRRHEREIHRRAGADRLPGGRVPGRAAELHWRGGRSAPAPA